MKATQNNIFQFDKIIGAIVKYVLVITHSTNIQTHSNNKTYLRVITHSTTTNLVKIRHTVLVNKDLD